MFMMKRCLRDLKLKLLLRNIQNNSDEDWIVSQTMIWRTSRIYEGGKKWAGTSPTNNPLKLREYGLSIRSVSGITVGSRRVPSPCGSQWPPWDHHWWLSYCTCPYLLCVGEQSQAPQSMTVDWNLHRSGKETETDPRLILLLYKHHLQHVPEKTVLGNYHSHIDSVEICNWTSQNRNTQLNSIINPHCGSLWIISYKLNIEYSSPAAPRMLIFMVQSL